MRTISPPGDSRPVHSNQAGPHSSLERQVRRHLRSPWRAPMHAPSLQAFEALERLRHEIGAERPVVLDAGCGTGESTRRLAERHPEAVVVGIDRSAARLARVGADSRPVRAGRILWARAELGTFWRLAGQARWPVRHQYLLYPNPWPKAAHLGRRWHAHPVFPALLGLGGELELRGNWKVYLEEFARAVEILAGERPDIRRLDDSEAPLSPFEAKYAASGHTLWVLRHELPKTAIKAI